MRCLRLRVATPSLFRRGREFGCISSIFLAYTFHCTHARVSRTSVVLAIGGVIHALSVNAVARNSMAHSQQQMQPFVLAQGVLVISLRCYASGMRQFQRRNSSARSLGTQSRPHACSALLPPTSRHIRGIRGHVHRGHVHGPIPANCRFDHVSPLQCSKHEELALTHRPPLSWIPCLTQLTLQLRF